MNSINSGKIVMPSPVKPSELPQELESVLQGLGGNENILEVWVLTSHSPMLETVKVEHELEAGTWALLRVGSPPVSIDGEMIGDELVPINMKEMVRG